MHLGPPVLDKVERSWSCWRHPNASGVGLKVAGAMETVEPHKAQSDFLEGGCGRVRSCPRTASSARLSESWNISCAYAPGSYLARVDLVRGAGI